MIEQPLQVRRFVQGVRRRILIVRVAESVALMAMVFGVLGLMLLAVLWLSGRNGGGAGEGVMGLGILSGLMLGFSRRPTLMQAAAEADRQLRLADLLTTAMTLGDHHLSLEPRWSQAVAATAAARCARVSPSMVIVAKLGGRAYSGAAVVAALVMTVSIFGQHVDHAPAAQRIQETAAKAVVSEEPDQAEESGTRAGRSRAILPAAEDMKPAPRIEKPDVTDDAGAAANGKANRASRNDLGAGGEGAGFAEKRIDRRAERAAEGAWRAAAHDGVSAGGGRGDAAGEGAPSGNDAMGSGASSRASNISHAKGASDHHGNQRVGSGHDSGADSDLIEAFFDR